jgi:hypothetical protein
MAHLLKLSITVECLQVFKRLGAIAERSSDERVPLEDLLELHVSKSFCVCVVVVVVVVVVVDDNLTFMKLYITLTLDQH